MDMLIESFLAGFRDLNLFEIFSVHESEEIFVSDDCNLLVSIRQVLELLLEFVGPLLDIIEAFDFQRKTVFHNEIEQMLLMTSTLASVKDRL